MTQAGPTNLALRWGQLFALVLTGAVFVQGTALEVSLQTLLESAPQPCVCEERGVCSRTPDGPCPCDRHHSSDPQAPSTGGDRPRGDLQSSDIDGGSPSLEPCEGNQPGLNAGISPYTPLVPIAAAVEPPALSESVYRNSPLGLTSQKVGGDIFRPPR